jgi:hypothetical protein
LDLAVLPGFDIGPTSAKAGPYDHDPATAPPSCKERTFERGDKIRASFAALVFRLAPRMADRRAAVL